MAHGSSPWEWYASANRTNLRERSTKPKFRLNFALEFTYFPSIASVLLLFGYETVAKKHQENLRGQAEQIS
jgi:hypothetical protein